MRYDIWICRFGTFAVGLVAGGLYAIRHCHPFRQDDHGMFVPVDPHADVVALAVIAGVTSWLLVSLAIAKRRETVRARVTPGLILAVAASAVLGVASRNDEWPVTTSDAALVLGIGLLGSAGILFTPGSLRKNPWSKPELDYE